MFGLRLPELLIILVVMLLLFGSKKLPDLGDALGKGIRAFKKASEHAFDEDEPSEPKKEQAELPSPTAKNTPSSIAGKEPANKP